jgi:hypothetical protein
MPPRLHHNRTLFFTDPRDGSGWTRPILSPPERDALLPPPAGRRQDDCLMQTVNADLPRPNFRLQILRAWAAASGLRDAEVAGHA